MRKLTFILTAVLLLTACSRQAIRQEDDRARGADLSWLSEMEHDGVLFYTTDAQGRRVPEDCIRLLHDCGMNAVRLRVWVNHSTGWSNLPDMLTLARRVQQEGLQLMVDIHYSDFFADPSHQSIPEAWQSYSYDELLDAVRSHTVEVLTALQAEGIEPRWVQVGNETPNGMLWPVGALNGEQTSSDAWDRYAGLTTAGYEAAKQVFPDITVIVHVDNASERRDWFWQGLAEHGGRWDMIGLSHYPMMSAWNGGKSWQEMNELAEANIRRLINDWHCPVMIAEIGMFNGDEQSDTVMQDFIRRVAAIDSCAGIFYWEPECYGGWRPAEYIPLGWGSYNMGAFTEQGEPADALKTLLSPQIQ